MSTNLLRAVALIVGLCTPVVGNAQTPPAPARQDGIVAALQVAADKMELNWHFEATPPAPIAGVRADFNGRPLRVKSVTAYPAEEEDRTVVLCIVDVSGGSAREDDIAERKGFAAALLAMVRPHQRVGLYSAVGGLSFAPGADGKAIVSEAALEAFGISQDTPDLGSSLAKAIEFAADSGATRRGIFLFTDGHSAPAPDLATLTQAARAAGVAVYIYLTRGGDPAGAESLKSLAESTGGGFYTGEAIIPSLTDPFALLDSGATAEIPLAGAHRYFWEQSLLRVSIAYGESTLRLEVPVTVPDADFEQTVGFLWDNHGNTIGFSLAGAGWLAAFILLPFALRRRPRAAIAAGGPPLPAAAPVVAKEQRARSAPSGKQPLAPPAYRLVLTDPSTGGPGSFTLTENRSTIGRARDNSVVFANETVSGHQAVIVRSDEGHYTLINLSETNPTMVNGVPVQSLDLKEGDIIRFGLVEARFGKPPVGK